MAERDEIWLSNMRKFLEEAGHTPEFIERKMAEYEGNSEAASEESG